MANTTNTNGTMTNEELAKMIQEMNEKLGLIKDDVDDIKKRQDTVDKRLDKMKKVIDDAVDDENNEPENDQEAAPETTKDKIKRNLKFIVPGALVLAAVGGGIAYAVYKSNSGSCDVEIDDSMDGDVIDL